jgi:hypothetical protein
MKKIVSGENKKSSMPILFHDRLEISLLYSDLKSSIISKGDVLCSTGRKSGR